jgi:hypothetical protein
MHEMSNVTDKCSLTKTSRRNYLKVTQQRNSRKFDYLLLHVLKKFWWKLPEDVDSTETCMSKIIEIVSYRIYNHQPSSSVGSHVLIPRNLSVLSSTKIIS